MPRKSSRTSSDVAVESAEQALVQEIYDNADSGGVATATLQTDDRVLARITDGIYRQPGSALRELIANAYDADATEVVIETDSPRFTTIRVRDNGNGMKVEALVSLIHHIGGSPKRTHGGVSKGVVSEKDPSRSPGGRRLIGKIGIGLFSVAQLTRHFHIITRAKGSPVRLVAEVVMKTYTEEDLATAGSEGRTTFETGTVRIQSFHVESADRLHGTEIVLLNIKPQTRHLLQSRDTWLRFDATDGEDVAVNPTKPPAFHIGRIDETTELSYTIDEKLPWDESTDPSDRFASLYQGIIDQLGDTTSSPKLEDLIDNYLRMLWDLSLAAPVDYIDKHPFDLTGSDEPIHFELSNRPKGQAKSLILGKQTKLREKQGLVAPERGSTKPFRVLVDGVELKRPIRFNGLPQSSHALKRPLLFAGKYAPDLSGIAKESRGGILSFEGYFLWAPKIVPTENNGLLIRISDASGTLFDTHFIKYQVAERNRLRQITAEIFVLEGLDPALNIDRESFNYAHPHYQILMKWVHSALRQLANTQKTVAAQERQRQLEAKQGKSETVLSRRITKEVMRASEDVPQVEFVTGRPDEIKRRRTEGVVAFDAKVVFSDVPKPKKKTARNNAKKALLEQRVKGVAQVLEAYGVFRDMPYSKQQELLRAIVAIFVSEEQ